MTSPKTWTDFGIEIPDGAGGELDTTCPQCSPRRKNYRAKCLSVNTAKGIWTCHHCGWSGGLGTGQRTASQDDPYGAPVRAPKVWEKPRPIPAVTAPTTWQRVVDWFTARGIPDSILDRYGVVGATEYCPICEDHVGHVLFPYRRGGEHVNTKHRCGKKHFRMERGAERIFYGLDDCAESSTVIIVEGEIDKLSLATVGLANCLSVPDGAPAPDAKNYSSKFVFLDSAKALFDRVDTVILAADADDPGQALIEELASRIGYEKCQRVTWPDGIKDANECLQKAGPDALREVIASAEPFPIEGLVNVPDLDRDLDDLYETGYDPGVGVGWPRFDLHYRARVGLFTVVTGVPGHGKSTFIDNLMVRLATLHGWAFGICSPENQPLQRHLAGILSAYLGKPFHDGPTPRMSRAEMHRVRDWAAQYFAFILPEEPTLDAILDRAKALKFRMGIKGLVIDPWNELEHQRPNGKSETEYVSECLGRMRRFARHHRLQLWLIAHPTKLRRDEEGAEPVPGLWDISGSAHFRNKADAGLSIWRDLRHPDDPAQVHIQKIRFAETGKLGMVRFDFDKATGQYREVYPQ